MSLKKEQLIKGSGYFSSHKRDIISRKELVGYVEEENREQATPVTEYEVNPHVLFEEEYLNVNGNVPLSFSGWRPIRLIPTRYSKINEKQSVEIPTTVVFALTPDSDEITAEMSALLAKKCGLLGCISKVTSTRVPLHEFALEYLAEKLKGNEETKHV